MTLTSGAHHEPFLPDVLQDPADYYTERVSGWALSGFLRFAGQARSTSAREIVIRAASSGRYTMRDVDEWTRGESEEAVRAVSECDVRALLSLAILIANQRLDSGDLPRALGLFRLVDKAHGARAFSRMERIYYLELVSECSPFADFNQTFADNPLSSRDWAQAVLYSANYYNPWAGAKGSRSADAWHRRVNALYRAAGLEGLRVLDGGGAALDRVLSAASEVTTQGPSVTVLLPTRNPDARFGTAMNSLLNQSWRNLEILILDDGSDWSSQSRMRVWEERDARVRVLHMGDNKGNYAARNVGMAAARGDFVTVHDDDDWSHPRKVEMQVRHLIDNPDCHANMSQMVRVTPDLSFLRINNNPFWIQPNYSSLMYRREEVVDLIGYWDEVSKAADAEYRNRLTAATGLPPPVLGGAPMSLVRVRSGSLTEGEIQRAHIDPRRYWYDLSSRRWHARTLESGGMPKLSPASSRRFAAPWGLHPGNSTRTLKVDVVYATDFRFPGGNSTVAAHEIRSLLGDGLRVALLQMNSPVLVGTTDLNDRILQVSQEAGCEVVSVKDEVAAELLIVRHPTVLQFAERRRSGISARRNVLVVNHAPAMRDGTEAAYDIDACVASYAEIFGAEPLVAPESGVIRTCLAPRVAARMTDFDWTGTIAASECEPRNAAPWRSPVWGRHARDNREKWPASAEAIAAAYPVTGADVRVLGGARIAIDRLGIEPSGWTVYPFGSLPPRDYLEQLDFWVYFHDENLIESFGMATLEAMAAGLVVILPEYMRATFGTGALYCEPDQVQQLINDVWEAPDSYRRQSELALGAVRERFLDTAFQSRIMELMT